MRFATIGLKPLGGAWLALTVLGCLDRPVGLTRPRTTNVFVDAISQEGVARIDLLFMIDNSRSMSDKQAILRDAVPDLLERLLEPGCLDSSGNLNPAPALGEQCPVGQFREFNPVQDINIAVVSSSLGDSGANYSCTTGDSNDRAHLLGSLERGAGTGANASGFLSWRPGGQVEQLVSTFQNVVGAVGENGCSWEASLESWYRFLIDPQPYESLVRGPCLPEDASDGCVTPRKNGEGQVVLDTALLAQRSAFLRDDSLVAVILLTDENDCSIQHRGQYWVVAQTEEPMFRGSSACERDPNDACCYSCPLGPPAGCAEDPICGASAQQTLNRLPDEQDGRNLRCFDQKRRFGFDFLYPTSRYVRALSEPTLCLSNPDLSLEGCPEADRKPNPLFVTGRRDVSSVYLAGIVGVPWQLVASDVRSNGTRLGANELRFKTYREMSEEDWDAMAGSAEAPPTSPFMVESTSPRPGVEVGNEINGREYDTSGGSAVFDDLQYACIMPLSISRDCAEVSEQDASCDCRAGSEDSALCERYPGQTEAGPVQYWAKAYPGGRHLEVLRQFGDVSGNSVVASICARNVLDRSASDFGYRPAVTAILDRLREKLNDRCLPRRLDPAKDGSVPCNLVEVRFGADSCACDSGSARTEVDPKVEEVVRGQLRQSHASRCDADDPNCERACLCNVEQVQSTGDRISCQNSVEPPNVEGWCYIADTPDQRVGNPRLVAGCPATERRLLRFAGDGLAPDSVTFVACTGAAFAQ